MLDDAAGNAVLLCILKMDRFDPARGDPFSFFSEIILNAIRDHLAAERRRRKLILEWAGQTAIRQRITPAEARAFREELRARRRNQKSETRMTKPE